MAGLFRDLRADEIECRVAQVDKDGGWITLLLYKDARCDMNILDETVGPFNWKRSHSRENANCTVSLLALRWRSGLPPSSDAILPPSCYQSEIERKTKTGIPP